MPLSDIFVLNAVGMSMYEYIMCACWKIAKKRSKRPRLSTTTTTKMPSTPRLRFCAQNGLVAVNIGTERRGVVATAIVIAVGWPCFC